MIFPISHPSAHQKIAEITRFASNKKYDDKGNVTGQYWGTKVYDNGTLQPDGTIKPSEARTMKQRKLNRATTSALGPLSLIGGNAAVAKEDSKDEKALQSARNTENEAKQQTKLLREILKRVSK